MPDNVYLWKNVAQRADSLTKKLEALTNVLLKPGMQAKGLTKVVIISGNFLQGTYDALDKLFYGVPIAKEEYLKRTKIPKNPLKMGIIPILRLLVGIDFCNLITYALSKASLGKFDPNKPPETTKPKFEKVKWNLQKTAYDCLQILNGKEDYLYANNEDNKNKLLKSLFRVRGLILKELDKVVREPGQFFAPLGGFGPDAQGAGPDEYFSTGNPGAIRPDKDVLGNTTNDIDSLINVYPQLAFVRQNLRNAFKFLDKYTDYRQIDAKTWAKIQKYVNVVKIACQLIIGLNTPAAFLAAFIASGLAPGLQQQIAKVQKLIRPEKLIPFLEKIVKILNWISKLCQTIMKVIGIIMIVVTILIVIIRIIRIILKFLKFNPIPSTFATEGIGDTFASLDANLDLKFLNNLERTLMQINTWLLLVGLVIQTLLLALQECIFLINRLISKLRSCQYISKSLLQQFVDAQNQLIDASDQFYIFVKNKENNDITDGVYNPDVPLIDQLLADNLASLNADFPPEVAPSTEAAAKSAAPSPNKKDTEKEKVNPPVPPVKIPSGSSISAPYVEDDAIRQEKGIPSEVIDSIIEQKRKIREKKITNPTTKVGEYTIKIIIEEVVEKTFGLKRRYGIAVNARDELVVQSTPTYGSDSGVIIKEVEQLLINKGLVKKTATLLSPTQSDIIREATSYLYNRDTINWKDFPGISPRLRARLGIDSMGKRIPDNPASKKPTTNRPSTGGKGAQNEGAVPNLDNVSTAPSNEAELNAYLLGEDFDSSFADNLAPKDLIEDPELVDFDLPNLEMDKFNLEEFSVDPPDNEDENIELGLNAFINKLKGGRKLRRRMRKIFAKKLAQFQQDTSREDPKKYTGNVASDIGSGTNRAINSDQTIQSRNADFSDGEFLYQGIITKSYPNIPVPRTIFSGQLRADDKELAVQKLKERYDPNDEKGYRYSVFLATV